MDKFDKIIKEIKGKYLFLNEQSIIKCCMSEAYYMGAMDAMNRQEENNKIINNL